METNNIVCPVCHWDKHLTDARFCQSCGTELINYCNQVSLSDHDDKIVWTLGKKVSQLILCTERKWKITNWTLNNTNDM